MENLIIKTNNGFQLQFTKNIKSFNRLALETGLFFRLEDSINGIMLNFNGSLYIYKYGMLINENAVFSPKSLRDGTRALAQTTQH